MITIPGRSLERSSSIFVISSGQELTAGQDLAAYLRAGLGQENQFYVYGKEQVNRSLGHFVTQDLEFTPRTISRLQETIPLVFRKPIHLVISGTIQKTPEDRIQAAVSLIPFYRSLNPVEKELDSLNRRRIEFYSAPLAPVELEAAFSRPRAKAMAESLRPGHGRLIILSSYHLEKPREREDRYLGVLEPAKALDKNDFSIRSKQLDLGDPGDLSCWLDRQELFTFDEPQVRNLKDFYHNILSGFEADQVWFDAVVPGGEHQLAFSIFPVNTIYKKALSYPFSLKAGTTTYLLVSVRTAPKNNPEVLVRQVVDPDNRGYPF